MARVRVLIVEDEDLIRLILAEVLMDEGFHVVEAVNGDKAVELIDGPERFHAIVTDIHMPGERDGIAVGRHVRSRHPQMPVIYCTGRPDALNGAGPLGDQDLLIRKPYVPSQIVTVLRSLPALSEVGT